MGETDRRQLDWTTAVAIVAGGLVLSIGAGAYALLLAVFYSCTGSSVLYDAPSQSIVCQSPIEALLTPLEGLLVAVAALSPLGGSVMACARDRRRGHWFSWGILVAAAAILLMLALVTGQQEVNSPAGD